MHPSNSVRSMRHHPRSLPHEFADGTRQARGTGDFRLFSMAGLIVPHGFHDSAAAQVSLRQPIEMAAKMTLDLALRLGHEPEAGAIPEQRRDGADAERTRIPQRLERARVATEFGEAGLAPGEVVGLLARGIQHEIPDIRV